MMLATGTAGGTATYHSSMLCMSALRVFPWGYIFCNGCAQQQLAALLRSCPPYPWPPARNLNSACIAWFSAQVFPCGHYFCDGCAQQQLAAASPSCPYCRKHVTKAGVFRVSLAGSGAHDPEICPPEGPAVRDIKVIHWLV
jgi:hypothetical protein